LSLAMIALNLALTYWLARYALRPLLTNLVTRYGYKIPSITSKNALSATLVVRLTPGPPFFLQGYLLGLAEVPFKLYMIVSWLCVMPWAVGALVMGKGILNGNFKVAATGVGVIVVAGALIVSSLVVGVAPRVWNILNAHEEGAIGLPEWESIAQRTYVYDSQGNEIAAYELENSQPVALAQIPDEVIAAILAVEDREFYNHGGFSPVGIGRAVYNNVTGALAYDPDGAGLGAATTFAIIGSPSHPSSLGNAFLIVT
jgi:hypothetical protein